MRAAVRSINFKHIVALSAT